jgi:hypothetical protein
MMDPTDSKYIENVPFFWGIAFLINVLMGVIAFTSIVRRTMASYVVGPAAWVGWWSFANALSLVINLTMGPSYPFSYHQLGLFNETMVNLGFLWFMIIHAIINFGVRGEDDWNRIETLRKQITIENMEPHKHADK